MATKSLHVGNLSYSSTDAALTTAFAAFAPTNVRVVNNRGFGYVDVEESQIAPAIRAMNGRRLDGRALSVKVADPSVVAGIDRNGRSGAKGDAPEGQR